MVKKFTKDGKCCEDTVEKFNIRMNMLKKNCPDLVKTVKVVYDCKFTEFLDGKYSPDFDLTFKENELYKEKKFFQRLIPRDACLPGMKVLLHLSWNKNVNETFHYLDMNMAFTYALKKFR